MALKLFRTLSYSVLILLYSINGIAQMEEVDKEETLKTIPNIKIACQKLNHKLLLHVDQIYFLKNCSLHHIEDSQLVNIMIQDQNKNPHKISPAVFAMIPMGKDYDYVDYYEDFPPKYDRYALSTCKEFNNKIVSLNNYSYYFIENCKKRKFENYNAVEKFNTDDNPIYTISQYDLSRLTEGKPVTIPWKNSSIKEKSAEEIKHNLPSKDELCKHMNNKVASFHESFFYVDKCALLPIKDFNIEVQIKAQDTGGIKELTIEQALGLEEGNPVTSADVIKKLH